MVIFLAIARTIPRNTGRCGDDPPVAVNESAAEMAVVFNDGNDIRKLSSGGQIPANNALVLDRQPYNRLALCTLFENELKH